MLDQPRVGFCKRPLCASCARNGLPSTCCYGVTETRWLTPRNQQVISHNICSPESYQLPILSYHNAMPRTVAVLSQIVALHNTYYGVATLEIEKAGLHNAYSEFNIRSRWDALLDQGQLPLIMSAVNALEVVVQDLRDMEQCGMDDAGDFLAGELGEDPGTLNLLIMLLKLINGTPSEADLSEQLQQAVSRWMNYRFRHSPSVDKLLRTEVDRLVQGLEHCDLPVLHYLDVRDAIRRDLGVTELDLIALAIQACAEAGYEATGDKWIREVTVQLSNTARGVVITPTPTPRGIMLGLLGRMLVVNGTSVHGLPTGDRWYAETDVEYCTDAQSRLSLLTDLRYTGRHMIRMPVLKATIRDVPRWLTKLLENLIRGRHQPTKLSYTELMEVKASDVSPEGRDSALVWQRFFERLQKEESSGRTTVIRKVVTMRSLVRIATHAQDANDYGKLLAQRIIGSFEINRLSIRGRTWEMVLSIDQVGRVVSETRGTDAPADLDDLIITTLNDTQSQDNVNAVPSGSSMVYMWPMTRRDVGAHASWRPQPQSTSGIPIASLLQP